MCLEVVGAEDTEVKRPGPVLKGLRLEWKQTCKQEMMAQCSKGYNKGITGCKELLILAPEVREAFIQCEIKFERQVRIHQADKVDRIASTDTCVCLCVCCSACPNLQPHRLYPRQDYWSGVPFPSPGDLLYPEIELVSLALQILYCLSHQGSPQIYIHEGKNTHIVSLPWPRISFKEPEKWGGGAG